MGAENKFQSLKRVHYFFGQILSLDDFQAEQNYHRERLKRHNRFLHGWGVVTGLEVSAELNGNEHTIVISPGMAVDSLGNEIVVGQPHKVCVNATASRLYVIARYAEQKTDAISEGNENQTQYTRVEEGFAISIEAKEPRAASSSQAETIKSIDASSGVPIARLLLRKRRLTVDRKYRRPRTR
jgi:hypothetical protein